MEPYRAPLRDMRFVLDEVLDCDAHYRALGLTQISTELLASILEECARFAETVLAPTNRLGDEEGVRLQDGAVTTPPGFKEAYQQFCADGWSAMTGSPEYGGQGLPESVHVGVGEMLLSANLSWRTYSGLTDSAVLALDRHGTDELKATYLPKLISGEWSGTMCLTESHAGTDLGILRTRATPREDGSYSITGTKIFVTAGEHDLTDNIVHMVLAKLPEAPEGTRGISLFLVPKFLPRGDGAPGEHNRLRCGSIEKKMGIHGSATCVLHFEDATGWLVGEPNRGLACMFTMMNHARIGVGLQGLGLAELAFQGALAYARERLQGRAPSGAKAPEQAADPIIVHPDVRRMLLTQKALTEGCRAFCYYAAQQLDIEQFHPDAAARARAADLLALVTPIVKAFVTDVGYEVSSLGIQIFGGHGYIRETGMEQLVRDARITQLYEGTNGIQALDLLVRKVLGSEGRLLQSFASIVDEFCEVHSANTALKDFIEPLRQINRQWLELAFQIATAAGRDPDEAGAAATDFLQFSGLHCVGLFWAEMAAAAQQALTEGAADEDFYTAKLETANFYFERLLPRTLTHAQAIVSGAGNLMRLRAEHFAF